MSAMAAAEWRPTPRGWPSRCRAWTSAFASAGRVSNAVYFFPTPSLRPLENMRLRLGLLGAWPAVDFSQLRPDLPERRRPDQRLRQAARRPGASAGRWISA
ncbi:MAG: hypothetical protein M0C28_40960 [Candidatus Moduliflexus flocculans]|nr:hypothetical protein [Candidatus Moduliflexus flocculans]